MRNETLLAGLKGDTPIGVMAALGVLRLLTPLAELGGVRLGWKRQGGGWSAVLSTGTYVSSGELAALLAGCIDGAEERSELSWAREIKSVSPKEYREAAGRALLETSADQPDPAGWFAAFASELITKKGRIVSTPFDMTVAQQRFLAEMRNLALSLASNGTGEALSEALFGPWKYADDQHSFGWDPASVRLAAFTTEEPSKMKKAGVRAAVWLAFESLPFFPCLVEKGKLRTRGMRAKDRQNSFTWPVWSPPLSLTAVCTLLGLAEWQEGATGRGVEAVYSSLRFKPNQYMTAFQPAVLIGGS
jgi:hypothetical protein